MFGDAPVANDYCFQSDVAMGLFDYANPSWRQSKKGKGRGKCDKRRFSDEQIKSLETIFESEKRLDPGKKIQVARDLGLQPRQVSIWFQNKRARWKSKQLEHDYAILKADYDQLASRLESLKKEKHALISQLEKLKDLSDKGAAATSTGTVTDEDDTELFKTEEPPTTTATALALSLSDNESSMKAEWYLGILEEEDQDHKHRQQEDNESLMMNVDAMERGSSLQSRHQGPSLSVNSNDLLDDNSPTQWWDFWT